MTKSNGSYKLAKSAPNHHLLPQMLRCFRRFCRGLTPVTLSCRSFVLHRCLISPLYLPLYWHHGGYSNFSRAYRDKSFPTLRVVETPGGYPKFRSDKEDCHLKRPGWLIKRDVASLKKIELQRRKASIRRDPRKIVVQKKKYLRSYSAAERIKYRLERAKLKEALVLERLKKYEVPKAQGPSVRPDNLTNEEMFYLKKMGQKGTNYMQIGQRGVYGGVILNMHLHWKMHETVKIYCCPCRPGQVHEYAREIARLTGGIPIQIIGDDTIIFYRGKNYVRPKVLSPVDTMTRRKAFLAGKLVQALYDVRRYIRVIEKELELYHRHVALYGSPQNRSPFSGLGSARNPSVRNHVFSMGNGSPSIQPETPLGSTDRESFVCDFEGGDFDCGDDSDEDRLGVVWGSSNEGRFMTNNHRGLSKAMVDSGDLNCDDLVGSDFFSGDEDG